MKIPLYRRVIKNNDPYGIKYPDIMLPGEWYPWMLPTEGNFTRISGKVWARKQDHEPKPSTRPKRNAKVWAKDRHATHTWYGPIHVDSKGRLGLGSDINDVWEGEVRMLHIEGGVPQGRGIIKAVEKYGFKEVVLTGSDAWTPEHMRWLKERGVEPWIEIREGMGKNGPEFDELKAWNRSVRGYVVVEKEGVDTVMRTKEELLYRGVENGKIIIQCGMEGSAQKRLLRFARDACLGGVWDIREHGTSKGWLMTIATIKG